MKIDRMRVIDHYVGGMICFLLTLHHILSKRVSRFKPKPKAECTLDGKKILITKYLGMGSILLSAPMIMALRQQCPNSKIVLLTFDANKEFARLLGIFDEVISLKGSTYIGFCLDIIRVVFSNIREGYHAVFDLEFFARFSTIMSYLSGAETRVGYYLPGIWRGGLLTHPIHYNPHRHVTEIFAAQLHPFGISISDFTLPELTTEEDTRLQTRELLLQNGIKAEEGYLCINVNASDLAKERRWPRAYFLELIQHLLCEKKRVKIILIGSQGERPYVSELHGALPNELRRDVANMAGLLSIRQLINVLATSRLVISNDSGPLHIAAATCTPTISFFGPESPSLYGPRGENNHILYVNIYCSPCLNVYNAKRAMCEGDNQCLKMIKVTDVLDILRKNNLL